MENTYPTFNIITWFKDCTKRQNETWEAALQKFWQDEFILFIKNQPSLFDIEIAQKYLEILDTLDTDLDSLDTKKNFLHIAMLENNGTLIDTLVKYKPKLLVERDDLGNTPLHYAKDIGILITGGYYAYKENKEIFDLKNWYGETPFLQLII